MRVRRIQTVGAVGALAGLIWACETTRNPGGVQRDLTPPTIQLSSAADTQEIAAGLSFNVQATDNLGLKQITLVFSGGHVGQSDTIFTSTVTSVTLPTVIPFPGGSGAGGLVQIVATASDGALNTASDTLFIFLSNVDALRVYLLAPGAGAVASTGRGIPVDVAASQREGIAKIGFLVTPGAATNPTTPPNDSLLFTVPLPDSVRYVDTLTVLANSGTFNIQGFAEDSSGRRGTTPVITVTVLSAVNDTAPPVVEHTIASRVEVDDSVTVHATDPSGISWIGLRVQRASDGAVLVFDSVDVSAGNLTDVTRNMSLNLGSIIPQDSTPYSVIVRGYACDLAVARNCAFSQNSTLIQGSSSAGGPFLAPGTDTVIVVSGITVPFPRRPFPTQIADAIFNANLNELYLTNTTNDLVEVFIANPANPSFVAGGIPKAGAQPWGIAMWPADTLGNYINRIVVANSGGTQLAVMDPVSRLPLWRQDLPNFIIQTYRVVQAGGTVQELITSFDLSDRPQYVATVCRPTTGGGAPCHADSVFALYSTTPTPSQSSPFQNKGTLRMEKLINTTDPNLMYGKFFWEVATTSFTTGTDTLRIELHRGPPNTLRKVVLSACAGVTVDLGRMGLGDRTFARNSGNFTHAFFGEGGNVAADFARVMSYDARDALLAGSGTFASCTTGPGITDDGENDVDLGMSPGVDVSDFISNTATRVLAIATNFNGLTNAVRADSIYYLGADLRLKGTSIIPDNDVIVGMDMNYLHDFAPTGPCSPNCGGTGSTDNRVIFAARPDGTIAVFDTYFGYFVGAIAVRDPIIGPLRVARDATGTIQYLFGVTANGVVMVTIPPTSNPGPTPPVAGSP